MLKSAYRTPTKSIYETVWTFIRWFFFVSFVLLLWCSAAMAQSGKPACPT